MGKIDFTAVQEESTSSPTQYAYNGNGALHVSTSRKGLLSDENPRRGNKDILSIIPNRLCLVKNSSSGKRKNTGRRGKKRGFLKP
jgi:hypothetical protein